MAQEASFLALKGALPSAAPGVIFTQAKFQPLPYFEQGRLEKNTSQTIDSSSSCIQPTIPKPCLMSLVAQVWSCPVTRCLAPGCLWTGSSLPPEDGQPTLPRPVPSWLVVFPPCPACPLHSPSSPPPGFCCLLYNAHLRSICATDHNVG